MSPRFILPALTALALTVVALVSFARGAEAGVVVTKAWARATPPGASVGAAYLTIENNGATEDTLESVATAAASMPMVHETIEENGVSQMREARVVIPSGKTLEMKPGGIHIMLMGLAAPLKEGDTLDLTLVFERAGEVSANAIVGPIGASAPP